MWPPFVVIATPGGDDPPCLEEVLEPADAQAFLAQFAVEALHVGVLRGLARLDVHQVNLPIQSRIRLGSGRRLTFNLDQKYRGRSIPTGTDFPPMPTASWHSTYKSHLRFSNTREIASKFRKGFLMRNVSTVDTLLRAKKRSAHFSRPVHRTHISLNRNHRPF